MFKALFNKYVILPLREKVSLSLMQTFGFFGIVNFPLLYILGASLLSEEASAFYLRAIGFAFCLFLALIKYWPVQLKPYQHFYWFIAITYSLPFFGTYMFLANKASLAWQVKITVGIFWLVLVTNWVQFLVILSVGMSLALLTFTFIYGSIQLETNNMWGDLLNCGWSIVIASIFARRKEITQKEKQQSLRMQAAAIAHEMRTPLGAVNDIAEGFKRHLPTLIKNQTILQQKDTSVPSINSIVLESLEGLPTNLEKIARSALTVIDTVLINLQEVPDKLELKTCLISDCVKSALEDYSLADSESALIVQKIEEDFEIKANPHLLKHVFFNLLKNSLYYVKAAGKGQIFIWTEKGEKFNKLHFKDTGKGIPSSILPYIFDQFYTRTDHGTGVGLAFCKMVMQKLGGDITCDSVEGEFTHFTLSFPVVK